MENSDSLRRCILVVDDERTIADTLALILCQHGYQALAVYDGYSALERARSLRPQLMISDVVMPGMNGTELAVRVSQECPSCRVLLFSGQAATADLLKDVVAQGYLFEVLSKPVHPQELLTKINELLAAGGAAVS